MRNTIQLVLLVLIYVGGAINSATWILTTLMLICISINVYFHLKDKRELSQATYYIRPKTLKTFREIFKLVLVLGFVFSGVYILFRLLPEEKIHNASSFYFAIALLSHLWGNYYQTFKLSLRAFDFGITIPKKGEKQIFWNSIKNLDIECDKLVVAYLENEKYTFDFDKRDLDDALKIKNQFLTQKNNDN